MYKRIKIPSRQYALHSNLCNICTMAQQDIAHSNLMRYEASGNTDLCRNVLNDLNHQCK